LWVWVQAVFSLIGLGFIMKAYLIGEVTYVSIFEYSMLIFATLTAWFVFGDKVGVSGVLGIGLIIVTGTVVLIRSKER
jgi:drug/metabolite transporter (DMT)-like permease